jgi:hypothetical protein
MPFIVKSITEEEKETFESFLDCLATDYDFIELDGHIKTKSDWKESGKESLNLPILSAKKYGHKYWFVTLEGSK